MIVSGRYAYVPLIMLRGSIFAVVFPVQWNANFPMPRKSHFRSRALCIDDLERAYVIDALDDPCRGRPGYVQAHPVDAWDEQGSRDLDRTIVQAWLSS